MGGLQVAIVVLFAHQVLGLSNFPSDERDIWNALFSGKDVKKFIPSGRVNVSSHASVVSLSDYEPVEDTIRIGIWLLMRWKIPQLKWDAKKFKGKKVIRVPPSEMWTPDIVPYSQTGWDFASEALLHVSNDGTVLWVPHVMTTVLCGDYPAGPKFPRDQRKCRLKYGSWVYDGFSLNLTRTPNRTSVDTLSNFVRTSLLSSGWKLVDAKEIYEVFRYPCCEEPYPSIALEVIIQRSDTYFFMAVGVPGAVTGLVVSLLYLLTPSNPARIVAQTVCLLLLALVAVLDLRLMGNTSALAPAARYFVGAMVLDLVALFWSIAMATVWAHAAASGESGGSVRSVVACLQRICCLPGAPAAVPETPELSLMDKDEGRRRPLLLSDLQRLCLALDRLLCLVSLLLFVILFAYLSA